MARAEILRYLIREQREESIEKAPILRTEREREGETERKMTLDKRDDFRTRSDATLSKLLLRFCLARLFSDNRET